MKHSKETRGFSSDSFPSLPSPLLASSTLLPSSSTAAVDAAGIRSGDAWPFALQAGTTLHWPPAVALRSSVARLAAGDTDLRPDLSPGSLRNPSPTRTPLLAAFPCPVSLAEYVRPTAPSLLFTGDGEDLPLPQPRPMPASLSLLRGISPETERFLWNFAAGDLSTLALLASPSTSSSSTILFFVTVVEAEKPSLMLQTSEFSSDISPQAPLMELRPGPPFKPLSIPTSSFPILSSLGLGFGVSESTSFTVSSWGASASSGGGLLRRRTVDAALP